MRRPSVRILGLILAPLVVGESILGIVSAGASGGSGLPYLVAHVVAGLALSAVAVGCLVTARHLSPTPARVATVATALALLATASTGAVFLVTANGQGLVVDRVLALAALAGAVAMIVTGGTAVSDGQQYVPLRPGDGPPPPTL